MGKKARRSPNGIFTTSSICSQFLETKTLQRRKKKTPPQNQPIKQKTLKSTPRSSVMEKQARGVRGKMLPLIRSLFNMQHSFVPAACYTIFSRVLQKQD